MKSMNGGSGGGKPASGAGGDRSGDCPEAPHEKGPDIKVQPIREGTVIDHIPAGLALTVLSILGITGRQGSVVSVAINVYSKGPEGRKDIVKIEDRALEPSEIDKIALIAPNATINIIKGYKVVEKYSLNLPDMLEGILQCPNPNCISNQSEPVEGRSVVASKEPLVVKCFYCGKKHLDIIGELRY